MEHDLNAAVEDYRRRLADQAKEVERLERAVEELEEQAAADLAGEARKSLARARKDLDAARGGLDKLRRRYARFRLQEGLGNDPSHLDAERFDRELRDLSSGPLTRREPLAPGEGVLEYDTFRSLMLADLGFDQLIENERAERRGEQASVEVHQDAGTPAILRHWAARIQSDPFVAELLAKASDAASRFSDRLAAFARKLDNLRINYEIKQRQVDELSFASDGARPAIRAENFWENIEGLFADDARACLAAFYSLEQARDEVRKARDTLNHAFRAFFSVFVPRYVTYTRRQSKARRRRLRLGRFHAGRLCRYLLRHVEATDFLLPRGGGIELAVPRIPRHLAPFRKLKAFRDYKKALEREAITRAPTVAEGST